MSGAPIVSGSAVWAIDTDSGGLFAYNLTTGVQVFSYNLGSVLHFETPTSADGMIFASGNMSVVAISIST